MSKTFTLYVNVYRCMSIKKKTVTDETKKYAHPRTACNFCSQSVKMPLAVPLLCSPSAILAGCLPEAASPALHLSVCFSLLVFVLSLSVVCQTALLSLHVFLASFKVTCYSPYLFMRQSLPLLVFSCPCCPLILAGLHPTD